MLVESYKAFRLKYIQYLHDAVPFAAVVNFPREVEDFSFVDRGPGFEKFKNNVLETVAEFPIGEVGDLNPEDPDYQYKIRDYMCAFEKSLDVRIKYRERLQWLYDLGYDAETGESKIESK